MISKPTVFIIGAGAGADIDMCVGSALMKKLAKDVNFRHDNRGESHGNPKIYSALQRAAKPPLNLNELLAVGRQIASGIGTSGSIDNYIHNHRRNEAIKTVGKIAIVNTILDYEKGSKVFVDQTRHPFVFRDPDGLEKSWYHDFFRLLGQGIIVGETLDDIFDNVSIINFNYDRCLEQYLWKSLQNRFSIDADAATRLMSRLRIHHPYGKVAGLIWQNRDGVPLGGDPHGNDLDLTKLSTNIRTYNEEVEQGTDLAEAREWLRAASRAVFLGFHFHDPNVELIKAQGRSGNNFTQVYATVLDRRGPEQALIRDQIQEIFKADGVGVGVVLEPVECKELFSMYGTTFAR